MTLAILSGMAEATTLVEVPVENQNSDQVMATNWWSHFNDALLSQLIGLALKSNTSIRTAQAALQQSRALSDVNHSALWPGVSVSGTGQRSANDVVSVNNSFKAGLDAHWELDVFGANQSSLNASQADAKAAQALSLIHI